MLVPRGCICNRMMVSCQRFGTGFGCWIAGVVISGGGRGRGQGTGAGVAGTGYGRAGQSPSFLTTAPALAASQ